MNDRSKPCRVRTAMLVAAAVGLASPVLAATGQADSWDRFLLLVDRNIFLRDRRRPDPRRFDTSRPAPADDRERRVVLTGTALCGEEFIAFFEDTRTGDTLRVRAGGAVGAGELRAVTLDEVEYESGGKTGRIKVGFTLAGEVASLPARRAPPAPAAASDSPPTPPETKPETQAETNGQEAPKQEAAIPPDGTPDAAPKETLSPGGPSEDDIADILERMRRRREEELKR